MRVALILLIAVLAIFPDHSEGIWGRFRFPIPRIRIPIPRVRIPIPRIPCLGKRDLAIGAFDKNQDGFIDQSEAEQIMEKRDAVEFMDDIDEDGDNKISLAEFEKGLDRLSTLS